MKGDFSRQTFDPRKHYAGVLMQQGRVQIDADWNEQEAIQRRRTQLEAQDVIGRCGAPRDAAGFEIGLAGNELTIGAGRYYVDGLLARTRPMPSPTRRSPTSSIRRAGSTRLALPAPTSGSSTSTSGSGTSRRSMTACCARSPWADPTRRHASRPSGRCASCRSPRPATRPS